ncbi:lysophospholipase [Anoxybacterium hadale]|uniref:Lysophospholipase n=1 Tax=Anoxybacterium hadale TaxID=3408580 RepID=A0ACD1A821_9FIRM|nr:lysophospholipase [Clostridiales bacterium]
MYSTFLLHNGKIQLMGYAWNVDQPKAIACLIHGIGEHAGRYDRIGEALQESEIGLIAVDLRGHGLSAGKRGHTAPRAEILRDIDLLIEYTRKIHPDVPIVLYGHSMGGNLALDYRNRGKYRSLLEGYVITSPWLILMRKIPFYLYQFSKLMAVFKPDFTMNSKIKSEELGNSGIIAKQENKHLIHGKITVRTALDGFDTADRLLRERVGGDDGAALKPFLLMQGDADQICDPEGSRRLARLEAERCTYIEWPDLYHEIHSGGAESDGAEVIETIAQWIIKISIHTME